TAAEVQSVKAGGYRPREFYERDTELRGVIDMIGDGTFSRGDAGLFRPMLDHLLDHDEFMLLADYRAYVEAQAAVERAFRDRQRWTRMSILNTARSGRFSSDRAIQQYCEAIWGTRRVPIGLRA
ncbi:MAG: glycogen/starch/alpha-glucan phosphorylase, partial [Gammaproteobacteria bacterium]|nr:glycogen/starch/alpha-glucan phosphorylase [Gammaproteobacteria bacterium]